MKADILRRAEAIIEEDEEDEEDVRAIPGATDAPGQASSERVVFSPEDELEEVEAPKIKVMGDGEETSESDTEAEDGAEEKVTPETLLELAWIRDPKLFDRNAATRRSKGREQLRKDTGEPYFGIVGRVDVYDHPFQAGLMNKLKDGKSC